jgi:hypothetical protein
LLILQMHPDSPSFAAVGDHGGKFKQDPLCKNLRASALSAFYWLQGNRKIRLVQIATSCYDWLIP